MAASRTLDTMHAKGGDCDELPCPRSIEKLVPYGNIIFDKRVMYIFLGHDLQFQERQVQSTLVSVGKSTFIVILGTLPYLYLISLRLPQSNIPRAMSMFHTWPAEGAADSASC